MKVGEGHISSMLIYGLSIEFELDSEKDQFECSLPLSLKSRILKDNHFKGVKPVFLGYEVNKQYSLRFWVGVGNGVTKHC